MAKKNTLETIWTIPDDLWALVVPLLPPQKKAGTAGRPPLDPRRVFDGIMYVQRTGCQWKRVPREFGSGSAIHEYFTAWTAHGVFERLWGAVLERYGDLVGIDWRWQSADGAMVKAPLGGEKTGPNPTDRAKSGVKRMLLVDGRGAPLSVELTSANRNDMKMLAELLDQVVVERPAPTEEKPQGLCLDKGFDYEQCENEARERGYTPHIRRRGEEIAEKKEGKKPRRWVVERSHSWYNRYRKVLVRFEKKAEHYLSLIDLASALIVYRLIYQHSPSATPDNVLRVCG